MLLVPSLRMHAAPAGQAAGRAEVAKAGTVIVRAPEPGRLKGGDGCVFRVVVSRRSESRATGHCEGWFADLTSARLLRAPDPPGLPGAAGLT